METGLIKKNICGIISFAVCIVVVISGTSYSIPVDMNKTKIDVSQGGKGDSLLYLPGETYLYPPWAQHGNWTNFGGLLSRVVVASLSDNFRGSAGTYIAVPPGGVGWANAQFFHSSSMGITDSYHAPCEGYYEVTFYYHYEGEVHFFVFSPYLSYIKDKVYIRFIVEVYDSELNFVKAYSRDFIIDEGEYYTYKHDVTYDNEIETPFTAVYIPEGGYITMSAQMSVYECGQCSVGGSEGLIIMNGSLEMIKIVSPNCPPNQPSRPEGPTSGTIGMAYTYTTSATDPDGDQIYYKFSWGDGSYSSWLGPYDSGDIVSASHSWSTKGNYEIRVKAKDIFGAESEWSDPLPISMPKYQWLKLLPRMLQRVIWNIPL